MGAKSKSNYGTGGWCDRRRTTAEHAACARFGTKKCQKCTKIRGEYTEYKPAGS